MLECPLLPPLCVMMMKIALLTCPLSAMNHEPLANSDQPSCSSERYQQRCSRIQNHLPFLTRWMGSSQTVCVDKSRGTGLEPCLSSRSQGPGKKGSIGFAQDGDGHKSVSPSVTGQTPQEVLTKLIIQLEMYFNVVCLLDWSLGAVLLEEFPDWDIEKVLHFKNQLYHRLRLSDWIGDIVFQKLGDDVRIEVCNRALTWRRYIHLQKAVEGNVLNEFRTGMKKNGEETNLVETIASTYAELAELSVGVSFALRDLPELQASQREWFDFVAAKFTQDEAEAILQSVRSDERTSKASTLHERYVENILR